MLCQSANLVLRNSSVTCWLCFPLFSWRTQNSFPLWFCCFLNWIHKSEECNRVWWTSDEEGMVYQTSQLTINTSVTNAPFWTKRAEVLWKIIKERLKTDLNYFPRKKIFEVFKAKEPWKWPRVQFFKFHAKIDFVTFCIKLQQSKCFKLNAVILCLGKFFIKEFLFYSK